MKINIYNLFPVLLVVCIISCKLRNTGTSPEKATATLPHAEIALPQEGVITPNGMVVSEHPLASKVGADILKRGGNAVDASVATFFALAVVYPQAGNIGGGGFAVYRMHDGKTGSLDFREKAPMKAFQKMYQDSLGNVIEGMSLSGHLAAGVPGSVDGMVKLHEKFGKLSWQEVMIPAIKLAADGHLVTPVQAGQLNRFQKTFDSLNQRKLHLSREQKWKAGDTIFFKDLAKTLTRIQHNKRAGFYEGKTAQLIIQEMQRGKGMITQEDLTKYKSVWRKPIHANYKNYKLISMAPPSSGGLALAQLMLGIEDYPIRKWGHRSAKTIHIMTELERRVYADRATYLGDPDFVKVPVDQLLNQQYIKSRNKSIRFEKKTPSQQIKEGNVNKIESFETTHFSVVDKQGNAVSVTTTVNGYFGCKIEVEGAGFFLNNQMDDFSAKVGHPNQFGLVGGKANAIASEKRMLSSMSPTILEKDGQLFMVLGSPGGSTIITTVFQTILNVVEHQMNMQQAVNASRLHHQWLPDVILVEPNVSALDSNVVSQLTRMGHTLKSLPRLGKVSAILVRPDRRLEGAADKRRSEGMAQGY